jgi:DNA repair protein RecO (recombination protein O)
MSLEKTEAIILRTANWSESSRTVTLFSRDFGKITLVDKGGRRFTAKRGRLMPFARLEITFYASEKSARGYVSEVELVQLFAFEKEGTLGRLAYASAACELLNLLLSDREPQQSLYRLFITFLQLTEAGSKQSLPSLFIAFLLHLLSHLGYHPSLSHCVGCGAALFGDDREDIEASFCPERGGIVCSACQTPGEYYLALSGRNARLLAALQSAPLNETAGRSIGYKDASLVLEALVQFVNYQTGITVPLKSLGFLEKLKNSRSSGTEQGAEENECQNNR